MSVLGWFPRKLGRMMADQVHDRLSTVLGEMNARIAMLEQRHVSLQTTSTAAGMSIFLDYPTSAANRPRWTRQEGSHPDLRALIETDEAVWSATVRRIEERGSELLQRRRGSRISEVLADADPRPCWRNAMMSGLDGAAFGAFLSPRTERVIEIGSGNSTKFIRHFVEAFGLQARVISVDPFPRAECDALCDEVIREPFETVDLALLGALQPGDLVFFDGSHRCFMNSDVTAFSLTP